ncbi:MAG: RidA family protein [Rhodobiaceae bacterium]|nr:RidA family protein [Rhodobiaceae bacterium]
MIEITRARGKYKGRNAGTRAGDMIWAVATDQSDAPDMYSQTKAALAEIDRVLAELGSDRTRLVNVTVYVAKIQLKDEMEKAWLEWIGDDPQHWPQRACVEAPLYKYTLVEFVVIAAAKD